MSAARQPTVAEAIQLLRQMSDTEFRETVRVIVDAQGRLWIYPDWTVDEVNEILAVIMAEKTRRGV